MKAKPQVIEIRKLLGGWEKSYFCFRRFNCVLLLFLIQLFFILISYFLVHDDENLSSDDDDENLSSDDDDEITNSNSTTTTTTFDTALPTSHSVSYQLLLVCVFVVNYYRVQKKRLWNYRILNKRLNSALPLVYVNRCAI